MEPSESKNKRTTIAIVGMVVTVVAVVAAAEQDSRILLVRTRDKASRLSREGDTWKSGGGWGSKEASAGGKPATNARQISDLRWARSARSVAGQQQTRAAERDGKSVCLF
jgi:hypothetical protein